MFCLQFKPGSYDLVVALASGGSFHASKTVAPPHGVGSLKSIISSICGFILILLMFSVYVCPDGSSQFARLIACFL